MSKISSRLRLCFVATLGAALVATPHVAAANESDAAATSEVSGVVVDEHTGDPISGAVVESVDGRGSTETDGAGEYELELPVGDHILLASASGFEDVSQEVYVPVETTVTADFALPAKQSWQVDGAVNDGDAHNWPLYAKVSFVGLGEPIFTDPATGTFTEVIPEGEYTVFVESMYPGYQSAELEVTVEGGDTAFSQDLELSDACVAPGYEADGDECTALDGGLVVGHVLEESGQPVNGAVVEDPEAEVTAVSAATPDDEELRDGFVHLFTPVTGEHEFEVRHEHWPDNYTDVAVVGGEVVHHEFPLLDD